MRAPLTAIALVATLTACSESTVAPDAGAGMDTGPSDAGASDAGPADAGIDAGIDAGTDAGPTCAWDRPCPAGFACMASACEDTGACREIGTDPCGALTPFCGCDGVTLEEGSPSCNAEAVRFIGECDTPTSCDPTAVLCDLPPPSCSIGLVPEVADDCYTGDCVAAYRCTCSDNAECPGELLCQPWRRCD